MGSKSDLPVMKQAIDFLNMLSIPYEVTDSISSQNSRKNDRLC